MNVLDLALVVAIGLLLAVLALWAVRPPRRSRTFDGGTVRKVRQYQTPGALAVVEAEPEPESVALAPYQPPPAPLIRINTQASLPQVDSGPGWELERRTPHRTPSLESDFAVPALQAGMTAFAVGVGAAMLAWAAAWSWRVPVAVCGATFVLSWLWRLRIVDGLLWTIETIIRRDVDGDNHIGQPTPQHAFTVANPSAARSTVAQTARQQAQDTRRAELLAFVHTCATHGTSERAHGVKATGPDREKYLEYRDALLSLGLAQWRNPDRPKAGWLLAVDEQQAAAVVSKHVL